jgi:hypothetical protein
MSYYQNLTGDSIQVPASNATPECILTWVRKADGTIRLFASRDLPGAGWGQRTTEHGSEVHWHLATTMRSVLIYDAATAAEAIQWVLERWAREDAAEQQRVERLRQHAIAGHMVIDPKAITNIGGGEIL